MDTSSSNISPWPDADGLWRCENCGDAYEPTDSRWRVTDVPEHACGPIQCGHFRSRWFGTTPTPEREALPPWPDAWTIPPNTSEAYVKVATWDHVEPALRARDEIDALRKERSAMREAVEFTHRDLPQAIHTALRKAIDGRGSAQAWRAIMDMDDGAWAEAVRVGLDWASRSVLTPRTKADDQ